MKLGYLIIGMLAIVLGVGAWAAFNNLSHDPVKAIEAANAAVAAARGSLGDSYNCAMVKGAQRDGRLSGINIVCSEAVSELIDVNEQKIVEAPQPPMSPAPAK
jgi:hypothetical protein